MKNSSIALLVIAVVIIAGLAIWFYSSPPEELKVSEGLKIGESQYVEFTNNNTELQGLNPPASALESWGVPTPVASMIDGNMGNLLFAEKWGVTFTRIADNSWDMRSEILSGQLKGLKLHCIFTPTGSLRLVEGSAIGSMQYIAEGTGISLNDAAVVALFNPSTGEGPGFVSDWEVQGNSYSSADTVSAPIKAGTYDMVVGITALPQ